MTRKTVGEISTELKKKAHENTHSADEQMREQLGDYESHISQTVSRGRSDHIGDFYVVVITKKERLMDNVLRNYFFTRQTCPTPEYDQIVYQYHRSTDTIEFLWVVPSKHACEMYKQNKLDIAQEEWELLKYVLEFEDGTLLKKSKKLNNEQDEGNKICQTKKHTIPKSSNLILSP